MKNSKSETLNIYLSNNVANIYNKFTDGKKMSVSRKNIDLIKDIDELSEIAIDAFELTYTKQSHSDLHKPLLRWCDFLLRYIAPQKRKIYKSDRLISNTPDAARAGFERIEKLFTEGGNVNPYQSKTLTIFNDTSGKNKNKRTDNLWADWGIHHLHLPLEPVNPSEKYSKRSEWVLFIKVYEGTVFFIDIKNHNSEVEPYLFSQRDLIETFISDWPEQAEYFGMRHVSEVSSVQNITNKDIADLRRNGINVPIVINGQMYMPLGFGVTTATTSRKSSMLIENINRYAKLIEEGFSIDGNCFVKEAKLAGITNPKFELTTHTEYGLGILLIGTEKIWIFPRVNNDDPNDIFCKLNNILLPAWAGIVIVQHLQKNASPASDTGDDGRITHVTRDLKE